MCFRYLGFKSLDEVDNITLREFRLLMKAHNLQMVDKMYLIHQQAFQNFRVKSVKKSGSKQRYLYTDFGKFFDYQGAEAAVLGKKPAKKPMSDVNARYLEYLRKKEKEGENDG